MGHQQPKAATASPAADLIALDTLGKLYAHGPGITGYFNVPMPMLIAAHGSDSPVVIMRPLRHADRRA